MRQTVIALMLLATAWPSGAFAAADGGFDRAIESAVPRVVKLYGLRAGREAGYGSGILVSEDGLVLTVFSLLVDARHLRAVTADGRLFSAEVLHRDPQRQLALLRLRPEGDDGAGADDDSETSASHDLTFEYFDLTTRDASDRDEPLLQPGDWILAAGNAFKVAAGSEPVSITYGVFSARTRLDARRRLRDFPYQGDVLVIDAITSNPGAAGGAVVNLAGELVGMIGRQVISNLTRTHFNYAIPRDVLAGYFREASQADPDESAEQFVAALLENMRSKKDARQDGPELGFRLSRVGYKTVLPFVEYVRPDSPADEAGLRKDDLILSVNGRSVSDVSEFDERVRRVHPGDTVELVVRRARSIFTVRIKAEEGS